MPKTAKDYPLTLAHFGINADDDNQLDAVDAVLRTTKHRMNMASKEQELKDGSSRDPYLDRILLRAIAASLQARGIRPEELRS